MSSEAEQFQSAKNGHLEEQAVEPTSLDMLGAGSIPESPALADASVSGGGEDEHTPALNYMVVGVGSSAGGLVAFRELLQQLPPDTGMSFVLVPHLAPDQVSHLKEINEHYTSMPVLAIKNGDRPEPDHLYILQPNQTVQLQHGRFLVEPRQVDERIRRPIDLFFRSLGADQRQHAIGVVLSGADSDGALGLKSIKGEGGLAIVQSPETAQHSSMPRTAIMADHVDLVLAPAAIAAELARLASQFKRLDIRALELGKPLPTEADQFQKILQLLRTFSGLELRQYKPDTLRRRIARRMVLLRMESMGSYAGYLQAHREELHNLQEDVLINVTRFFRDPPFWETLADRVLPDFFHDRAPNETVRIWSAGCSSGEEVYSLAMTLLEYMSANNIDTPLQIFGTDASERSIDLARSGFYPETLVGEISQERVRRFFTKVERGYQVKKSMRDLCIFARQNLCSDPPFSNIDFLCCRNVLIYFNQPLQRQVISTFHYALKSFGYLLLGSSETLRDYDDAFSIADRKNKMYAKLGSALPGGYDLPALRTAAQNHVDTMPPANLQALSDLEMQRAADRLVLSRFGPPGLVVDSRLMVMQVRGQTSPYVELASGTPSWSLNRVLRDSLVKPVREAVERAVGDNMPATSSAEFMESSNETRQVRIHVLPLSTDGSPAKSFLVLFTDATAPGPLEVVEPSFPAGLAPDEKDRLNSQLRQDLQSTRMHLQALVEERDSRNQELVSANEEIQSANEELQSTNEELETTKEELQSANEELITVNDELLQRNNVLTQTGNDLINLLTSVNIPLLMLTESLQIRQFTPPLERLLSLRPADVGRSISDIRLQLSIENIEPLLHEVLETLSAREVEVRDREGKWHLMRIRPYRTSENKIEGLVVVLVDIDQLRRSQQGLSEARDFADSILQSVPVPVVVVARNCTIRTVNAAFRNLTGLPERDLVGRSFPDFTSAIWGIAGLRERMGELMEGEAGAVLEFEHASTTPDRPTLLVKAQALATDGDRVVLLTMEDVTQRRQSEQVIAQQKQELEHEIERTNEVLLHAQEERRELASQMFTAQEDERRRVARELHDDVAQRLSATLMDVEAALLESENVGNGLQAVLDEKIFPSLQSLNTDVRQISHRLHPAIIDDLGLVPALKSLIDEFREREQMPATLLTQPVPEHLPSTTVITLYRIAQESLRNVAKHAGKTHVKLILDVKDDKLCLEIRDSGFGFDQEADGKPQGLGLLSIKERARIAGGHSTIRSTLGKGTIVSIEIPVHAKP